MQLCDDHPMVLEVIKLKKELPHFVLCTESQLEDLKYFMANQGNHPLGIDRTFNLGSFFVTALVYKNLRVVRKDSPKENPLFLGPIFLHKKATFEAYHAFFSAIKARVCQKNSVRAIEVRVSKKLLFGSDEEQALTKSIENVFPSSTRLLCTNHMKENARSYMRDKAGVPQKKRGKIIESLFGDNKKGNDVNQSVLFDKVVKGVRKLSKDYPIFLEYFEKHVKPAFQSYVFTPSHEKGIEKWTNNNCESLNHILKLDAKWRTSKTPELIELIHQVTVLHFRDFRRALYGEGNYRLVKALRNRYGVQRSQWRALQEADKEERFKEFLQGKRGNVVRSTISNFVVPKPRVAKKPGQRTQVKRNRTAGKR